MSAVQAFLQHLQVERRMSAHTLDAYRRDLDALAVSQPRGVAVEALDADALRQFVADEHRRGLSAKSLQRRLSACRSFYAWLLKHGRIEVSPAATLKAPRAPRRLPQVLTPMRRCSWSNWSRTVSSAAVTARCWNCSILRPAPERSLRADLARPGFRQRAGQRAGQGQPPAPGAVRAAGTRSAAGVARGKWRWSGIAGVPRSQRANQPACGADPHPPAGAAPGLFKQVHPHMLRHSFASHILESSGDPWCAGAAGPCRHRHHADLYPPRFPAPGQGLRRRASAASGDAATRAAEKAERCPCVSRSRVA